jgi:hypothetical protein
MEGGVLSCVGWAQEGWGGEGGGGRGLGLQPGTNGMAASRPQSFVPAHLPAVDPALRQRRIQTNSAALQLYGLAVDSQAGGGEGGGGAVDRRDGIGVRVDDLGGGEVQWVGSGA